jgi:hypothetical protein
MQQLRRVDGAGSIEVSKRFKQVGAVGGVLGQAVLARALRARCEQHRPRDQLDGRRRVAGDVVVVVVVFVVVVVGGGGVDGDVAVVEAAVVVVVGGEACREPRDERRVPVRVSDAQDNPRPATTTWIPVSNATKQLS